MKKFILPLVIFVLILNSCSKESETKEGPDIASPTINFSIAGSSANRTNEGLIVVSNQIDIGIDAQDAGGIAKVEVFIDEVKVGEDVTAPYEIVVNVSSYSSKGGSTAKYKDYILKITATNKSGNIASKEQKINIDNEQPVITAVTLTDNMIINGDTNIVTFEVMDNEELVSVKAFLNNELLLEIPLDDLSINIDSNSLKDGRNTLKIVAMDAAENIGSFEVSFISDNTGPQIVLDNLEDGQILDIPITLTTDISDELSEIASLEIFYGNENLFSSEYPVNPSFELDPTTLDTGDGAIVFVLKDALANESTISISVSIMRRLTVINFPPNFYDPQLARMYVFASKMSGELLDIERIDRTTERIVLRTSENVPDNIEFMLSFGKYMSYTTMNNSELTTIANISNLSEINLKVQPRFDSQQAHYFPITGFDDGDTYNTYGYNFGASAGLDLTDNQLRILTNNDLTTGLSSDFIYLWLNNLTLNEYSYTIFDSDLSLISSVDKNQFTQTDIEQRTYNVQMSNGNSFEMTSISIYAYFNEYEFLNNIFHSIGGKGYQYQPSSGFLYNLNTSMYKYKYELRLNDYYTERTGLPKELFVQKDWSIDYTFNNKIIDIATTGSDHTVGKIIITDNSNGGIDVNGGKINYLWEIAYDSQKQTSITLPEIPEELQSWGFYQFYKQSQLDFNQIQVRSYEGVSDYQDYLNKVIKNNTLPYLVSPNMEAKVKGEDSPTYFFDLPNFLID